MQRRVKSEIKVQVLREHLENNVSMSELAEKYHVNVNSIMNWKKKLFESAPAIFDGTFAVSPSATDTKIGQLEQKLQRKEQVIAELAEENVSLKKSISGEI